MFNDLALYGLSRQIFHLHRAEIAAASHHAEHGSLSRVASPGVLPLPFVLIALFAADECFVDSDIAGERFVEGFGLRCLTKPVRHSR